MALPNSTESMINIFIICPCRSSSAGLQEMVQNKCTVLRGPGHFVSAGAARYLQNEISLIVHFPQPFGQGSEIRVPRPKRDRAGSQ